MPDRVDAVNERIAKRLDDVERFMRKMQRYVVTEEWDLARGLCHVGAAVFEGLRDDTNLLADLEGRVMALRINRVLDAIAEEVVRATGKHPTWPVDPMHALAVVGEEFGELSKATLQTVYESELSNEEDVEKEAIQLGATVVRFLMALQDEEYEFERCDQRRQMLP